MPDPADYVDAFEQKANEWHDWYRLWEKYSPKNQGVPGDDFVVWGSDAAVKFLREADELMQSQVQVNAMFLAAIDDLKKLVQELKD